MFWLVLSCIGRLYGQSINQDSLLNKIDAVHDTVKIDIYKKLASNFQHTNPDSSLLFAQKGLEIAENIPDTELIADMVTRIGVIHYLKGDYAEAIKWYMQAKEGYESIGASLGIAITCTNIAIVHRISGEYDKALEYLEEALSIDRKANDSIGMAMDYNNMAPIYAAQNDYEKAIETYENALAIYQQEGSILEESKTYTNLADTYERLNDYKMAEQYLFKSLSIKEKINDDYGKISVYINLGILHTKMGKLNDVLYYLDEALRLSEELGVKNDEREILLAKSEYYKKIESFERALSFYTKYKQLSDSLFNESKSKQINELEIKYESVKNAKEIEKLRAEALHQKRLINIAVILVVLIIVLFFLIYNRVRLKHALLKKDSLLEAEKMQRLQDEIDARNRELVSDTMHVIRKNELLENVKGKLQAVSKQHEVVKKEIREVLQLVQSNINFEKEWEDLKIHFEQVHPRFFEALTDQFSELTQHDLKHCAYIKLNLSNKEVARMLNVDAKSVRMSHYRLKKKLDLSTEQDLSEFVKAF